MFWNKNKNKNKQTKNNEMTDKMKEYYMYHYGTTDKEYVDDMLKKLKLEKTTQRVNEYIKLHNIPKEKQFDAMKFIVRFHWHLGFETAKAGKPLIYGKVDSDLVVAKIMYRVDTSILTKQLVKIGYSQEEASKIVENSYSYDDLIKSKSLRIEDYDIVDGKMVMKLEKDIFERYNKEHQTQEVKPEEKAL